MNLQTNPQARRLLVVLALLLVCLLFLALSQLQQPAYSQGLSSSEAAGNAEPAAAPAATATSCPSDPPTGLKSKIVAEDEIGFVYRYKDEGYLRHKTVDLTGPTTLAEVAFKKYSSMDALTSVSWTSAAAADVNGDGKKEIVSAVQDKNKRLAVITNGPNNYEWYYDSSAWKGDNVDWIGIAAGNLDRTGADEEVVVAFGDQNNDIRLVVLDGDSAGNIGTTLNSTYGYYSDTASGRGDVDYVAVGAGDINGDGYDDEIVTAFQDSNSDLQVLILRRDPSATNSMRLLWSKSWTDNGRGDVAKDSSGAWRNKRPIAVAVGDVDGDMRDEAVLAYRVGDSKNGNLQLLVLKFKSQDAGHTTLDMDDTVWAAYNLPDKYRQAGTSVSLATGDMDNDGVDEIAFGYNTTEEDLCSSQGGSYACNIRWQQHLVAYEYVPFAAPQHASYCGAANALPCLHKRSGQWNGAVDYVGSGDDTDGQNLVVVAMADLDQDGMDEIVLAHGVDATGNAELLAFNAESGLSNFATFGGATAAGEIANDFWLIMGDTDGNSKYATYTGACYSKVEAHVLAVIHSPPHGPDTGCDWSTPLAPNCSWGDNYLEAQAKFGTEATSGEGYSTGTTTSIGAEVSLSTKIHEIGPSFTYGWEKSYSTETSQTTSTSHGSGFETRPAWVFYEEASDSGVQFVRTEYDCYVYHEATYGDMAVCLPIISGDAAYRMEDWYSDEENGGLATYPDSWVPVGINLAQGRTASQSSEYTSPYPAGLAVDGNIDGSLATGSVSHTGYQQDVWWQVDLGGVQQIDGVQIWNRTDCCGSRLSNFYVFVSEEPFPDEPPGVLAADPAIWRHYKSGAAGRTTTIPVGEYGRYVRVQLDHKDYLHLAEVQVWGTPGEPKLWPRARPTSSNSEKFTVTWSGNKTQEVPGQLLYTWPSSASYKYVGKGVYGSEFSIGLDQEGDVINEGSTASSASLGMGIKFLDGSASYSYEQQNSYILSWSKGVDFSGVVGGLPGSAAYTYYYAPYVWLQRAKSSGGVDQAFFVLDYWLQSSDPPTSTAGRPAAEGPRSAPVVTPAIPLLDSPTHPDPATWVLTNTATFNWSQPPGDPAVIAGYTWRLDRAPDTAPHGLNLGPATTRAYHNLADGVWTMHVRAESDDGGWSGTAHRTIRVDANPPEVQLALEPASPDGHNGWYVTPLTAVVTATEILGSGVAGVEVSTDGVAWRPYSAPLVFDDDTTGTTIYARATDAVGHVSEPISTTFKIDRTPPDSHVAGGQGPGALVAGVFPNALGNQVLALAGAIVDDGSGRAGMSLEYDGLDWTGATAVGSWPGQQIQVNWIFTATHEIGAGNHIFLGRAQDEAGNLEEPYEIARVLWPPLASPAIAGSSLTASPAAIRPGEVITFTVVARNAGWQEAHVSVVDTLPAGLAPVIATLASDVSYDPAARTLTWPARLLWPGQWVQHTFQAQAAAGLPATMLENRATFHALWPNTDLLPPAQQQPFLDHEQTVVASARVAVNPGLPAGADVTPPWITLLRPSRQPVMTPQVALRLLAAPDARWMYLREWTPDPTTGDWTVAGSSGWIDYTETYTWTLSAGQGVRYLGVWVADRARNISTLDEHSMVFVNRLDGSQTLADGQRVQYRGDLEEGTWLAGLLTTVSGDPDLYAWKPRNGFRPDAYRNDTVSPGQTEDLGHRFVQERGRFLLEVQAVGDSEYRLTLSGKGPELAQASYTPAVKPRPQHPLVISDPLSAGQVGAIDALGARTYLPLVLRNN